MSEKAQKLDLANIVAAATAGATQASAVVKPKGPSPALVQKAAVTAQAVDAFREADAKAKALRQELLLAMKAEGVNAIPMSDRKPITLEEGEACSAPSQGVLKANLTAELAEKVWAATKKPYERIEIPKPEGPSEPLA